MTRSKADSAWKEILELYLKDAIEICFPQLYATVDWTLPIEFLDKELHSIVVDSLQGHSYVDKLLKLFLLNGEHKWLLFHIEIQGDQEKIFQKRMFVYHYRIFDKFGVHPLCFAILTDDSHSWRPNKFYHANLGCELSFIFPTLKILDLESQRKHFEASHNPFASVLLIQLDAIKLANKLATERMLTKFQLTKRLYTKGFSVDTIRALYKFVDSIIRLPPTFEIQYKEEIYQLEKENNMAYISTIEQFGIEKGLKQGKQQIVLHMLQKGQSIEIISDLTGLSMNEITELEKIEKIYP